MMHAEDILGANGRLLDWSKSDYLHEHPDNVVVFNANIITSHGKMWYGDIDVTKDEAKLKEYAEAIGEKIYVLREMDARFENENKPLLEKAVFTAG